MDYWPQFFQNFFTKNQKRITNILDARSCREYWIQGEMYLDRPEFIRVSYPEFKLVDIHGLAGDDHPEMIAEVKVISFRGYSREDILGFGGRTLLHPTLANKDVQYDFTKITDYPQKLNRSIFKDYLKLKNVAETRIGKQIYQGEKYLLLVIPYLESAKGSQNPEVDTIMKTALEKISLAPAPHSWQWDFNNEKERTFSVRLWRITS